MDELSFLAQEENPLLIVLEQTFRNIAPEWEFVRALYPDQKQIYAEWKHGDDNVIIQVIDRESHEGAAEHFGRFGGVHIHIPESEMQNLYIAAPKVIEPDTKLPQFAGENNVWTSYDESGRSLIKFRNANLIFQVDASSYEVAKRFAEVVVEHLPAS